MAQMQSRVRILYERVKNPAFALTAAGTLLASRARARFTNQGTGGAFRSAIGQAAEIILPGMFGAFIGGMTGKWPARRVPNVLGIISDLEAGRSIQAKRFEARPALVDTGALRDSIRFTVAGTSVTLLSSMPYASLHEKGGTITRTVPRSILPGLAQFLKSQPEHRSSLGWLFYYAKKRKAIKSTIPARPFLAPTPRDIADAMGAVKRLIQAGG